MTRTNNHHKPLTNKQLTKRLNKLEHIIRTLDGQSRQTPRQVQDYDTYPPHDHPGWGIMQ